MFALRSEKVHRHFNGYVYFNTAKYYLYIWYCQNNNKKCLSNSLSAISVMIINCNLMYEIRIVFWHLFAYKDHVLKVNFLIFVTTSVFFC